MKRRETKHTLMKVDEGFVWVRNTLSEAASKAAEKQQVARRKLAEQPILRDKPGKIIMEPETPAPPISKKTPPKPRRNSRLPAIRRPSLAKVPQNGSFLPIINGPTMTLPDRSEITLYNGEPREDAIVVKLGLERWFSIMDRRGRRKRPPGPVTSDKIRIIKSFGEGVVRCGDRIAAPGEEYDVLVMLQGYRDVPEWNAFRGDPKVIYLNGDWFVSNKRENRFFQVSLSANPGDPNSCSTVQDTTLPSNERIDSIISRMDKFHVHHGSESQGKDILVLPNATKGYGHSGVDPVDWSIKTVEWLLRNTDRGIWFRQHPRDDHVTGIVRRTFPDTNRLMFSDKSQPLDHLLNRIHAAVVHNTTATIPLVMRGIPFVYTGKEQIASPLGDPNLNHIMTLKRYSVEERKAFLYSLFKYIWTEEEMRSGYCWKTYRREIFG